MINNRPSVIKDCNIFAEPGDSGKKLEYAQTLVAEFCIFIAVSGSVMMAT